MSVGTDTTRRPAPDLPPAVVAQSRSGTFDAFARPVGIIGTGMFVPARRVTNDELVGGLDTTDAWIRQRTGICERRWLEPALTATDMMVAAAADALVAAGVAAADLGAVVVATFTGDQPLPSNAVTVASRLGATGACPLDLNQAACAGGVLGIWTAAHLVAANPDRPVLVIGSEVLSRVTDPQDRSTRVFFGDAAGAVVLGTVPDGAGLESWHVGSELSHAVGIRAGGASRPVDAGAVERREHYLHMDGRTVWDMATRHLPASVREACAAGAVAVEDVDRFVFHQANLNIVHAAMDALGRPRELAAVNVDRLGNTGAATIFLALHESVADGALGAGDRVSISAIGAGFIWGSLVLRHVAPRGSAPLTHRTTTTTTRGTTMSMTEHEAAEMFVELYQLDVDPAAIGGSDPLFGPRSAFGRDSMDVLKLIAALRERYRFDIGDLKTESFLTTSSIVDFLGSRAQTNAEV
ncbi:beta-ketoacyl-ACP synthase 3 [Nocardioides dongxiaopingii]|uniref:beta-ketoacyl-ACP synthase 3 n=1 Tax=Nocardioides dongxiaopingii TaxID=2576036 RepID=UPI0010C76632|nr:beta-ketoacyl-ACP synthase 3 [Nocardioides dongxiaopingii]